MSVAIASMIVLVIVGALGGLLLSRTFGQAAARNENRPGGGNDEGENPQGSLSEEARQSVRGSLGAGASVIAILLDVVAMAAAFVAFPEFVSSATSVAFLALILVVVGYFLGARKLAIWAAVFTVAALAISAVVLRGL